MAKLYGRDWKRADLVQHVGEMGQIASIRESRLVGGLGEGVRLLDWMAGDGLRFLVVPDRCMDIPHLEYRGVPLTWFSRDGIVAPAFYEPWNKEFLRAFSGGLVTTCGLTQVGQPCDDHGEHLPLHGRISGIPADEVWYRAEWAGDDYVLSAGGHMRETKVFSQDLHLTRTLTTRLGEHVIRLHDRVENRGPNTLPFMILYHCNVGFPVLSSEARLLVSDEKVEPKDEHSRQGLPEHTHYTAPQAGWEEMNYWHQVKPNAEGWCQAAIVNEALDLPFGRGLGLAVYWRRDQLWNLVQWKQMGIGDYVAAIEPANCHTLGRCKERELGTLEHIQPGEVREFDVEWRVLVGNEEIKAFEVALPR